MAEGYITTDHDELTTSLRLKDFEDMDSFDPAFIKCFWDKRGKTGLACELELTVQSTPTTTTFVETSGPELHAEQVFIRNARRWLRQNRRWLRQNIRITPECLSVTMLISNSPCFKCREDLQEFFISCGVPNVYFTLRIARLYLEKSTPDEAERKLDYWIKDLEVRGVSVCLSAINVISETNALTTTVSMNEQQKTTRIDEDARVNRQIGNIQNGTTHVTNLIKHFRLSPDFKQKYFIDENDHQMILLQLIVSAVTRSEQRPTGIRESLRMNENGDNHQIEKEIRTIKMPLSWVHVRKCLVLVCAHVPSTECQEGITEFMEEKRIDGVQNKLILHIASIPVDEERDSFIQWIIYLESRSIRVSLQPFYVPFGPLSRQIVEQHYMILINEFDILKGEMESRMYPPTPPSQHTTDSSSRSDEETSSYTFQDEASMSPVGPSMQETIDMSETNSASLEMSFCSEEQASEEQSQSSQDELLMLDENNTFIPIP